MSLFTYLPNTSLIYYFAILFAGFLLCPKKTFMWRYAFSVLYVVDCLANAALLLGDARETISSRVGKAYLRQVPWIKPVRIFIDTLFFPIERQWNHCTRSIQLNVGERTIFVWK